MERQVGPPVTDGKTFQKPLLQYEGNRVILERLESKHARPLWLNVKGDDAAWDYMHGGPFASLEEFQAYIDKMSTVEDPYLYAIIPKQHPQEVIGFIALMSFIPQWRVVELGTVLYTSKIQRTTAATEVFYLIMKAGFEQLNARRLEWKTNAFNTASRKAALRLGFEYEGIFRNHMIVKGHSRDSAWFSIIESEWPTKKKALETWLSPSNFDEQSRQRKSLTEIAAEL